jgi:hypothetical protein
VWDQDLRSNWRRRRLKMRRDDVAPFYSICKPRFISGSPGVQLDGND